MGILTAEDGRYSRFWMSLMGLRLPPGGVRAITKLSVNVAEARNQVVREALDGGAGWVWFMDDDHTFAPDLLVKLLARQVDVIQPLVLGRYAPFGPVIMGPPTADGSRHWRFALNPEDPPGLKAVDIVGCAGMLVRRHVLEAIEPPWFEVGQLSRDVLSEDVGFCRKVKAAGFGIWCDLDNRMGHLNVGEVWPHRLPDGQWVTRLIFGEHQVDIPPAAPRFRMHADGRVEELPDDPGLRTGR